MNSCDKALEAVANGIVKRMERECTAEELLLMAQAAATITSADKMASGNLVEPFSKESNNGWFGKDKK